VLYVSSLPSLSHPFLKPSIALISYSHETTQSSIIGPNVIQAIINNTQNNWMGFPFLFAICAVAMVAIAFVDVEKGREDGRRFVEAHRGFAARVEVAGAAGNDDGGNGDGNGDRVKTGRGVNVLPKGMERDAEGGSNVDLLE
jgi:hypothetical protein